VIVPARDCANLLVACAAQILKQTRKVDEIVISVGPSADGTAEVAQALAATADTLRVVQNPAGDRGSALNVALDGLKSEFVAMVDAQSLIELDYVDAALKVIDQTDAAVVGGPMRPRGRTAIGRAMAAALRSPFGVGNSQFHFGGQAREVDSVYLGVYRRAALQAVGPYNPGLLRTEDDDMNARLRASGMRFWMDPTIRSTYLCRSTLREVWSQYYGYGYWKVALGTIRPEAIRLRQFVPAVFVLGLTAAAVTSTLAWWPALFVVFGAYVVLGATAASLAPADGLAARVLFVPVALTMHLAYGIGSLAGLVGWRQVAAAARSDSGHRGTGIRP